MKGVIASIGMIATLASASALPRPHHLVYRQNNGTEHAPQTTLTIVTTRLTTVTSCKPEVTKCAGRPQDQVTVTLTEEAVIATTVCPVADAEKVSSSIISEAEHSTTDLLPEASATSETILETAVSSKVLTYTLGRNSSSTVVTTTVPVTNVNTVIVTKTGETPIEATPVGNGDNENAIDSTTTQTSTRTKTRTVTAQPSKTNTPVGSDGIPVPSTDDEDVSGNAECTPVTITIPASTVYITVPAGTVPTKTPSQGDDNVPVPAEDDDEDDDEDTCDACDAADEEDDEEEDEEDDEEVCDGEASTTTLSTTVTAPFPRPTNGTGPAPTGQVRRNTHLYY